MFTDKGHTNILLAYKTKNPSCAFIKHPLYLTSFSDITSNMTLILLGEYILFEIACVSMSHCDLFRKVFNTNIQINAFHRYAMAC